MNNLSSKCPIIVSIWDKKASVHVSNHHYIREREIVQTKTRLQLARVAPLQRGYDRRRRSSVRSIAALLVRMSIRWSKLDADIFTISKSIRTVFLTKGRCAYVNFNSRGYISKRCIYE